MATISQSRFDQNQNPRPSFTRVSGGGGSAIRILSPAGFTLIEVLMVILLLGILGTLSVTTIGDSVSEARYDQTLQEMEAIRRALVGDTTLRREGHRVDFGYVGDVGALPSNAQGLAALVEKPATVSVWTVHPTFRISTGWSGPYITGTYGVDPSADSWGRPYIYDSSTNPAVIRSLGADGAIGGTGYDQDITLELGNHLLLSTIHGFISENGSPYAGEADVDIHYADGSGAAITASVSIEGVDQGRFQFSSIPFGQRSVTISMPNRINPTTVIGPIVFVVDRPEYIIPTEYANYNLSSSGGGTGGGGGSDVACIPAGIVSYVPGSSSVTGGGKLRVNFSVNITSAVAISQLKFLSAAKDPAMTGLQVGGVARSCPADFAICPVPESQPVALNNPMNLIAGTSVSSYADFTINMTAETSLVFTLNHDLGCDIVDINDL